MSVKVLSNSRVRLTTLDWDSQALDEISSGVGFRITEPGKSDINQAPGMYSIHSPLYGTDYSSERAFEDRYKCSCGNLIGANFDGMICPKCKTKVEYVGIDMSKTGWIILDEYCIIQTEYYKKIQAFIGAKNFRNIITYIEPDLRPNDPSNPYVGIGLIEFKEKFVEIMNRYLRKASSKKESLYIHIMAHISHVFAHSIPVYSSHLRMFVIKGDEIRYSDDDKLFKQIFTNVSILNNKFELTRRMEGTFKRKFKVDIVRNEHILLKIQDDLNKLWDLTFEDIKKKNGTIREQCLGGRLNFTARNVIIPNKHLRADEITLGYTTFLELYKLEIISFLVTTMEISHAEAWRIWSEATINFDPTVYKIMERMVTTRDVIVEINRNPSINYGSILCMRVVHVTPDINDHTMSLPLFVLASLNADFDGDVLNIISLKITSMANEFYKKMNPRNNLFIDRNDGSYNSAAGIFKDQILGLYAFANI